MTVTTTLFDPLDAIVWQLLATIPSGRVITYGALAKLAGYPSHARYVGRILKNLPKQTTLPWHRVVNARGELSFAVDSQRYLRQKALLESEGVIFNGHKIALRQYRWHG
ncbi:MGMT family protein [Marinagarivorans algicola]|uniref:MGMT family protein n=1 Tax=Marinagarivorans algicola TaxID=1513270 RepID=UPI0006B479E6|nr:MGMT family protein [Marinagarivorans algicola]